MIDIISSPRVAQWVASKIEDMKDAVEFGPCTTIGVGVNGKPAMGVVYSMFREERHGNDVRVTIAAESHMPWAKPSVLRTIFQYPFETLGCVRITCVIKEGNDRSLNLAKRLGFRKEGVLRRGWDGKTNALVYSMLKHECRYLVAHG